MPKMRTVTSLFYCHRVVMIYFHKDKKRQKRKLQLQHLC